MNWEEIKACTLFGNPAPEAPLASFSVSTTSLIVIKPCYIFLCVYYLFDSVILVRLAAWLE